MTQLPETDPDGGTDVRAAFATLVAAEPDLPNGADDIERRGQRRVVRRRAFAGAALAVGLLAGAGGLILPGLLAESTNTPVAAGSAPGDGVAGNSGAAGGGAAGGTQLATGFPLGEAFIAVEGALPAGVSLGELPMDVGWQAGGVLELPLAGGGSLTVTVSGGTCAAASSVLSGPQQAAVADAVCAAWRTAGSPEIVPAGPPGEERPDLAAQ